LPGDLNELVFPTWRRRISAITFFICFTITHLLSQEAVYFYASDGLKVRADLYLHSNKLPFIILCHHDGSNRSAFYEIAPRLLNMNYNCLAVDLRAGGNVGFSKNETASMALSENRTISLFDARQDIAAAIQYVHQINQQPVILLGGSYSASLCLLTAMNNPNVKAVVAFSPGEYFLPMLSISKEVEKMDKQVFIGATQQEYDYLKRMFAGISPEHITLFKPEKSKGVYGIKALDSTNHERDEYWFALMLFFKKLLT
jgi:pimeloyl-ACP methyl ester carboxylesterase